MRKPKPVEPDVRATDQGSEWKERLPTMDEQEVGSGRSRRAGWPIMNAGEELPF